MPIILNKQNKPADVLEDCKQRLRKARKGFRREKYAVYQDVMMSVMQMMADKNELLEFVSRNDINRKNYEAKGASWITLSAFVFVTGNYGMGWKGARISEFLHRVRQVPVKKLSAAFEKLGGIEKILKLAVEEDPKIAKRAKAKGGKKGSKPAHMKKPKMQSELLANENDDEADEDWDEGTVDDDAVPGDMTTISVQVSRRLLPDIMAARKGRRMNWICTRLAHDPDDMSVAEIQEIRQLKH